MFKRIIIILALGLAFSAPVLASNATNTLEPQGTVSNGSDTSTAQVLQPALPSNQSSNDFSTRLQQPGVGSNLQPADNQSAQIKQLLSNEVAGPAANPSNNGVFISIWIFAPLLFLLGFIASILLAKYQKKPIPASVVSSEATTGPPKPAPKKPRAKKSKTKKR